MSSQIDTQSCTIQQLITPICSGATTGDPSLLPYIGSLGYDITTPGELYVGTGTGWRATSQAPFGDLVITNVIFTSNNAQPPITGTMYLQQITTGDITMTYYYLLMQSPGIEVTEATFWTSTDTLPITYRPQYSSTCVNLITTDTGFGTANIIFNGNAIQIALGDNTFTGFFSLYTFCGQYLS